MLPHTSPRWFLARRYCIFMLLLMGISCGAVCTGASAQSHILKWEIEATVTEVSDPDKIFTNVRLGDPVRGFLRYDLATEPTSSEPPNVIYDHNTGFVVAGMTIENPRDGSQLQIVPDLELPSTVQVSNDAEEEGLGKYDNVFAAQPATPPDGFTGFLPIVQIDLFGPAGALSDTSLPTTLDLDDWPDATIAFYDLFDFFFGSGESVSYVFAEIHTLSPVPPTIPGDYDADSHVTPADYDIWKATFGTTTQLAADGNGNGVIDAADYVVWRDDFSVNPGASGGHLSMVPEPASFWLLTLAVALAGAPRSRRSTLRRIS